MAEPIMEDPLPTIGRLTVESFRRLLKFETELRPFTVMIGPNGVGKTSLLDVVKLISDAAKGHLEKWLKAHGGIGSCRTNDAKTSMIFRVSVPSKSLRETLYELHLAPMGYGGYTIESETLSISSQDGQQIDLMDAQEMEVGYLDSRTRQIVHVSKSRELMRETGVPEYARSETSTFRLSETALHQAPDGLPVFGDLRHILGSMDYYHLIDLRSDAPIRQPQNLRPTVSPGKNGEDLISCLFTLKESYPEHYGSIEETLRAGFPYFERFEFPPLSQGVIGAAWKDRRDPRALFLNQLSDGMLRFLWLVTALNNPHPAAITLVDEPEVSLHPELLSILSEVMREASRRTQLLVATHSDRFVSFLKPTEVLAMEADNNGATTARWGETFNVEAWLEEYTMGEIWRMGLLKEEHP